MSAPLKCRVAAALGGVVLACAASAGHAAAKADPRALIEQLVQCRASFDDLAGFNDSVDAHAVGFPEAKDIPGTSGPVWTVKPAVSALGTSSDTVLLNSRSSMFVVVASPHAADDVLALGKREGLDVEMKMDGYAIVRKDLNQRAMRAFNIDAGHYAAGCVYDEQAFDAARAARNNATPQRRAQKKALEKALQAGQ
ncbi:hypothetical protein GIY62_00545 [Burkholderia plantarii]|uniref:Lipoprotein n=1 Tax=Burkholderia plantarii TaxID=41899 RepID=A0A0B6RM72_BURPL|nr:hypothetical protein [Burkholderia plantarii]AJK46387.1 hypothetical protein BGL_1c18780 [Burkholderia plantarii]WLE59234.1 hypothetical protein GIY62_00545 [Burkholderia plantarii]